MLGCGSKVPQAEQGYCIPEEEFLEMVASMQKRGVTPRNIDRLAKENARCRALEKVYL